MKFWVITCGIRAQGSNTRPFEAQFAYMEQ